MFDPFPDYLRKDDPPQKRIRMTMVASDDYENDTPSSPNRRRRTSRRNNVKKKIPPHQAWKCSRDDDDDDDDDDHWNNSSTQRFRESFTTLGFDFDPELLLSSSVLLFDDDWNNRRLVSRCHSMAYEPRRQDGLRRSLLFINKSLSSLLESSSSTTTTTIPPLITSESTTTESSSYQPEEREVEENESRKNALQLEDIYELEDIGDDQQTTKTYYMPCHNEENNNSDMLSLILVLFGVISSGMMANIAFEQLNYLDPGCGSVFTLLQYVCVVGEKATVAKIFFYHPMIPWYIHLACVVFMFGAVMLGNHCLTYNLPFAQYLIIKNANPVFTILLGSWCLKKQYNWGQILSIVIVSTGVITSVLSQQEHQQQPTSQDTNDGNSKLLDDGGDDDATISLDQIYSFLMSILLSSSLTSSMFGALLCVGSSLSMACLGCTQEYALMTYGNNSTSNGINSAIMMKQPQSSSLSSSKKDISTVVSSCHPGGSAEMLFFTHLLGLPFFFVTPSTNMIHHIQSLTRQWNQTLLWGIVNVLSVVCCKHCFFAVLDRSSSLTATLAITMYRFLGIVNSVVFLSQQHQRSNPPPTIKFWFGAMAVAIGTISYILASRRNNSRCRDHSTKVTGDGGKAVDSVGQSRKDQISTTRGR